MTITVDMLRTGATPADANVVSGTQSLAAPSTWTRITGFQVGAARSRKIRAYSDAEPFRILVIDPIESTNTASPTPEPRTNGVLIERFGAGAQPYEVEAPMNAQVWVKRA